MMTSKGIELALQNTTKVILIIMMMVMTMMLVMVMMMMMMMMVKYKTWLGKFSESI